MLCLCTNTSCKWTKNGPWNFGQFAEIFQRGKDNFSSRYLIHLKKGKEILKEEKSYAFLPFYKFIEAKYTAL